MELFGQAAHGVGCCLAGGDREDGDDVGPEVRGVEGYAVDATQGGYALDQSLEGVGGVFIGLLESFGERGLEVLDVGLGGLEPFQ